MAPQFTENQPNPVFMRCGTCVSGIAVHEFTDNCKACIKKLDHQPLITEADLSGLPKARTFLSLVSRTSNQLRSFLKEENSIAQRSLQEYGATEGSPLWADVKYTQFWERSPLIRYPLLRDGGRYYCYSPILLRGALSSFIYTFLKEKMGESLKENEHLGGALESYVDGKLVNIFKHHYLWLDGRNRTETRRVFALRDGDKITDFLVTDGQDIVLVEVKAQDPRKKVSTVMLDTTRYGIAPIMEAVDQGYSTSRWIRQQAPQTIDGVRIPIPKEMYLIVVTYEEFYVGSGANLAMIGDFSRLDNDYGNQINKENIFCMSIAELDIFLGRIQHDGRSLFDALEFASGRAVRGDTERMTVFLEAYLKKLW